MRPLLLAGLLVLGTVSCSKPEAPALPQGVVGQAPAKATRLPAFQAVAADGTPRDASALAGKPAVLWFYMLAGTPDDTLEGRAFQALLPEFDALGVRVVAVGFNEPEKTHAWGQNERFTFEIWDDKGHALALALGAIPNDFAIVPSRNTYLVDGQGNVLATYGGGAPLKLDTHAADVLADAKVLLGKK